MACARGTPAGPVSRSTLIGWPWPVTSVMAASARLPRTASSRAAPMATVTRSSSSAHRSGVISRPGLNCSTRGSRVEKMAQTPFSYSRFITYLAPCGWSNSRPITRPSCRMPVNQSG